MTGDINQKYRKLLNSELGRLSQEQFKEREKIPIVAVLDNVRSQHNIGAAFRTSDAFLVSKIVLCGICATPPSAEIHKSALGAENSVERSYFKETTEAVKCLKNEGYQIISIEQAENSVSLQDFPFKAWEKYAFIFGNEVKGVQQDVVDMSDTVIEIPQYGTKHSLNVSVSIGLVLWEASKTIKK